MTPSKQQRIEQIVAYAKTLDLSFNRMLRRQSILEPLLMDEELKSTFSKKFQKAKRLRICGLWLCNGEHSEIMEYLMMRPNSC